MQFSIPQDALFFLESTSALLAGETHQDGILDPVQALAVPYLPKDPQSELCIEPGDPGGLDSSPDIPSDVQPILLGLEPVLASPEDTLGSIDRKTSPGPDPIPDKLQGLLIGLGVRTSQSIGPAPGFLCSRYQLVLQNRYSSQFLDPCTSIDGSPPVGDQVVELPERNGSYGNADAQGRAFALEDQESTLYLVPPPGIRR